MNGLQNPYVKYKQLGEMRIREILSRIPNLTDEEAGEIGKIISDTFDYLEGRIDALNFKIRQLGIKIEELEEQKNGSVDDSPES